MSARTRSAPAVQIVAGYAAGNRDRIASVAANAYAYIYIGAPEGAYVIIIPDFILSAISNEQLRGTTIIPAR